MLKGEKMPGEMRERISDTMKRKYATGEMEKRGFGKLCDRDHLKELHRNNIKHGMTHTRLYVIWSMMKQRCNNKKHQAYERYHGRGIKVCKEWMDFTIFKEDMYNSYIEHCRKYGEKQTTLDRINNDDGYYKENCRWATLREQIENRGKSKKLLMFLNNTNNSGISFEIYQSRKQAGWKDENIFRCYKGVRNNTIKISEWLYKNKEKTNILRDRHREILNYHYGIEDGCIKTAEQTAKYFGITHQRVIQISQYSINKIKNYNPIDK